MFEKALVTHCQILTVKFLNLSPKLIKHFLIHLVLQIAYCHVGLADTAHAEIFHYEIVIPYSSSYEADVDHEAFCKTILWSSKAFFLFRLGYGSGWIFPCVHKDNIIKGFNYHNRQSGIHLLLRLSADIHYHAFCPFICTFSNSFRAVFRIYYVAV